MLNGILAEAKESYKYIHMWHIGSKFLSVGDCRHAHSSAHE